MMFDRWCWRNEARLETQLTANLLLRWEEAKEEEERGTEKENLLFFVRPFQSRRSEFFSLWKDTRRERKRERKEGGGCERSEQMWWQQQQRQRQAEAQKQTAEMVSATNKIQPRSKDLLCLLTYVGSHAHTHTNPTRTHTHARTFSLALTHARSPLSLSLSQPPFQLFQPSPIPFFRSVSAGLEGLKTDLVGFFRAQVRRRRRASTSDDDDDDDDDDDNDGGGDQGLFLAAAEASTQLDLRTGVFAQRVKL